MGYYISTSNVLKVSDFNQEMFYCFVYNAIKLFNNENKSILPGMKEQQKVLLIYQNENISQVNLNVSTHNNKVCFADTNGIYKKFD